MLASQDPVVDSFPPTGTVSKNPTNLIDSKQLLDHITNIASALLGFQESYVIECHQLPLEQILDKLIGDRQCSCLYLTRVEDKGDPKFYLHDNMCYQSSSIVLIKKNPYLDQSVSLFQSLLVASLPNTMSESEKAHTLNGYVQFAFSPFMNSFISSSQYQESNGQRPDGKSALLGVKKKMAELQLCLESVDQDIVIPEIQLTLHSDILAVIQSDTSKLFRVDHFASRLDDTGFLNSLQANVNAWIREVQRVTSLTKDAPLHSAKSEVLFWSTMEKTISQISLVLESPGIVLTLDILRSAKRFHATVSFLSDTGLKEALDMAQKYNQLLKDFPIDDVLTAPDLAKLKSALESAFGHINRKLRLSSYPVKRGLLLVESISKDISAQVTRLLRNKNLMMMPYLEFSRLISFTESVFTTWDSCFKEFSNIARDLTRKRGGKFLAIRINDHQSKLREKLLQVSQFRLHHEELVKVIQHVNTDNVSIKMVTEVEQANFLSPDLRSDLDAAYDFMKHIDVLDLTEGGVVSWRDGEELYMDRVGQVENAIVAQLRDQLASASNTSEMFRVFSCYNSLFVRPKIRGAVHEYQTQLLNRVKADISALHAQFTGGYDQTETKKALALRDLPSLASIIMWAKQIERRLEAYMQRVEAVLGKGWDQYAEGQKLEKEEQSFKRQLNVKHLYDQWLSGIVSRDASIQSRIFSIAKRKSKGTTNLVLKVDFDSSASEIFRDVRSLIWLGFPVPHSIVSLSRDIRKLFPSVVAIQESILAYNRSVFLLDEHPSLKPLFVESQSTIRQLVGKFATLRWSYFLANEVSATEMRQNQFVLDFCNLCSAFQSDVSRAISVWTDVERHLVEIGKVEFDHASFAELIEFVQKQVDCLESLAVTNVEQWVSQLNDSIKAMLKSRLDGALKDWIVFWNGQADDQAKWKTFVVDIVLENKHVSTRPSIEHGKEYWLHRLRDLIGTCARLPRIQVFKFVPSNFVNVNDKYFHDLVSDMGASRLDEAYDAFHRTFEQVEQEIADWMTHEMLWKLQESRLLQTLGDDLEFWHQILKDLRKRLVETDHGSSQQVLGGITLRSASIRERLSSQYEYWYTTLLQTYSTLFAKDASAFSKEVRSFTRTLESMNISGRMTDVVLSLKLVLNSKTVFPQLEAHLSHLCQGQRLLDKDHFSFPDNWIFYDQLHGDWSAFVEIFTKQTQLVDERFDYLRARFSEEIQVILRQVKTLVVEWDQSKPISGNLSSAEALSILNNFEKKFSGLREEWNNISIGFEFFDLPSADRKDHLCRPLSEISDLRSVWHSLTDIQSQISAMENTFWFSDKLSTAKDRLAKLIHDMSQNSERHRHFVAFEQTYDLLQEKQKKLAKAWLLTSNVLRDRHLARIMKLLDLNNSSEITVGMIINSQSFDKNFKQIESVVHIAQGEFAIENFLREINTYWDGTMFDFVPYKSKCRLIHSWDVLINKCQDHLSAFASMKRSNYFKVHEQEAVLAEQKLQKLADLLEQWVQVQKQWVYLEGIFSDSADVRHLLPIESSKFIAADAEYLGLLRQVYKSASIFDVLSIQNIFRCIQKLHLIFETIGRALGDYLEKERRRFARFYFLGDENLLELLGNSNSLSVIQTHISKMFPGIIGLQAQDDLSGSKITHVSGRGGDVLPLESGMLLFDRTDTLAEWLQRLEHSLTSSLYALSKDAISKKVIASIAVGSSPELILANVLDVYPAQVLEIALKIYFTELVETAITEKSLNTLEKHFVDMLNAITQINTIQNLTRIQRCKCEQFITELVYQRNVIKTLVLNSVSDHSHFSWSSECRFYWNVYADSPKDAVSIRVADANFFYGFEYLGAEEKLVHTPLTGKCYLALTQALHYKMGGSPCGPAGTGKTETVKSLGSKLGRPVLVFCCDETFDFQSMGRIFSGLCQLGAWGCFDEFNRLEPRILSAVAQQIVDIQTGLLERKEVNLLGNVTQVRKETGLFITMNPDYAGRSKLPENLKKLFRNVIMNAPEIKTIAEVMLYARGFKYAEILSECIVNTFDRCKMQMSLQTHYDFGLRALKSVLVYAGKLLQNECQKSESFQTCDGEESIILKAISETVIPKLVLPDIQAIEGIMNQFFSRVIQVTSSNDDTTLSNVSAIVSQMCLSPNPLFCTKVAQLYKMLQVHHGIMLVGPAGTGKTCARKIVSKLLSDVNGVRTVTHLLDAKILGKKALYGFLDPATRDWTDGVFTAILRRILEETGSQAEHWIVFDGEIDPEWVENLNSVLDDNRRLTLPTGESLVFPDNVKIIFEVSNVHKATPATVTRCGMVWFPEETITAQDLLSLFVQQLRSIPVDLLANRFGQNRLDYENDTFEPGAADTTISALQQIIAESLQSLVLERQLLSDIIFESRKYQHIMEFSAKRCIWTLFNLLTDFIIGVLNRHEATKSIPPDVSRIEKLVENQFFLFLVHSFGGDLKLEELERFASFVQGKALQRLPDSLSLLDVSVDKDSGRFIPWKRYVPMVELAENALTKNIMIPTTDTVRLESIMESLLKQRRPVILCGPPGSGKTMSLLSCLGRMPEIDVVSLNFSSGTSVELLIRTLESQCAFRKTSFGGILSPKDPNGWLVVFCDEINLPSPDSYETQRTTSFLRFVLQSSGFWSSRGDWITLERIQFVGACNPPTDVGRYPLCPRFLWLCSVIFVDYPGQDSLQTIYSAFTRSIVQKHPRIRNLAIPMATGMTQFYDQIRKRFEHDKLCHLYVFSPRELTRWISSLSSYLNEMEDVSLESCVQFWTHEACRLFQDRLMSSKERDWTMDVLTQVTNQVFRIPIADYNSANKKYFCNYLSQRMQFIDMNTLQDFLKARAHIFCEEQGTSELFLFPQFIEHVLRLDRVLRQERGHYLLLGSSGAGKRTLVRFTAWLQGMPIICTNFHKSYKMDDFEQELRSILKRVGVYGEKVVFLVNETGMSETAFLERMNTLLTQGDVTGLFENDDYHILLSSCKDMMRKENVPAESEGAVYEWFTGRVRANLHVVFTLNVTGTGLMEKAIASPALVNRCNLDWFGDWTSSSLEHVANYALSKLDLSHESHAVSKEHETRVDIISRVMTEFHLQVERTRNVLGRNHPHSSRHFLDFVKDFSTHFIRRKLDMEERHCHLMKGLDRLKDTFAHVEQLRSILSVKQSELAQKEKVANEKLKSILEQQSQAERNRTDSVRLQKELTEQNTQIQSRQAVVLSELEAAEPAVFEAQESVSHIKRQHLTEVRAMGNPPDAVKQTMEAVCILLGFKIDSWKAVQTVLRRDDFISSIVNYDTPRMQSRLRDEVKLKYLGNENFTFETVNRASKACGPLMLWVKAQVNYAEILEKVGPLREEVLQLEDKAKRTAIQVHDVEVVLNDLETTIASYKAEYATMIADAQALKADMEKVESRISRSIELMNSLSSERTRWQEQQDAYHEQITSLVGDTLLAAAFINYGGSYEYGDRLRIVTQWKQSLQDYRITYNPFMSFAEYIASPEELRSWEMRGLPSDTLCRENAVILDKSSRYPLIIDPTGEAVSFLLGSDPNILHTSFRHASYLKVVETAMRFGQSLIVENAEDYDPILDPVISGNITFSGGRHICRLGSKEVDYSPKFRLFLVTKDPHRTFRADLCSRTVLISFTMTETRLVAHCLDRVLKSERPEIDEKKNDIIKLQGEYQYQLQSLEQELLETLNQGTGDILENDQLMKTLETLKSEANRIAQKVSEMDVVIQEIDRANVVYFAFAEMSSNIYLLLQRYPRLNSFYNFTLDLFFEIFDAVLSDAKHGSLGSESRLHAMSTSIYTRVIMKLAPSLSYSDLLVLGVTMSILKLKYQRDTDIGVNWDDLIARFNKNDDFHSDTKQDTDTIRSMAGFKDLEVWMTSNIVKCRQLLAMKYSTETADDKDDLAEPFYRLWLIRVFRPDILVEASRSFISQVMGKHILESVDSMDKLQQVVEDNEIGRPVLIAQDSRQDNGYRVEILSQTKGKEYLCVSLGSAESLKTAERHLKKASQTGAWVLIKNVHLEMDWIANLNDLLSSLHTRPLVFLTMDASWHAPASLLRSCRIVWYEPTTGLKNTISSSLLSISNEIQHTPAEKSRVFFGLAWLHAIILERLRYTPVGWSLSYDFGESEFTASVQIIHSWLSSVSDGRTNVSIDAIPWDMIQKLIYITVYGGKLENVGDEKIMESLVREFIAPSIMSDETRLPKADLPIPKGYEMSRFIQWSSTLPTDYPASWIGLPNDAKTVPAEKQGRELIQKLQTIYSDEAKGASKSDLMTSTKRRKSL